MRYTVLRNDLLESYQQLKMTNEELLVVIQLLSAMQQGEEFPGQNWFERRLGFSARKYYDLIQSLMEKDFLSIESIRNGYGQQGERYSLDGLFQKLEEWEKKKTENKKEQDLWARQNVFQFIENEFGRPLSSVENQRIVEWLNQDHYPEEWIIEAAKEAVLHSALNFAYINRILENWKQKGQMTKRTTSSPSSSSSDLPPVTMKKVID